MREVLLFLIVIFFSFMTGYCILINGFITKDQSYFLSLLNHGFMNRVVNYIIIGVISLAICLKKEETLKENERETKKEIPLL